MKGDEPGNGAGEGQVDEQGGTCDAPDAVVLEVVPEAPRGLADELVEAHDGDAVAVLRVELEDARCAEADAAGALSVARARLEDARASGRAGQVRLLELSEQVAAAQRVRERAGAQWESVAQRLARAEQAGHGASPDGRLLRFGSVDEFVRECAVPLWGHRLHERRVRWCHKWWLHAPAMSAFNALWEAFEAMRLEPPPATAVWTRDFLWPFMNELTSDDGPFQRCDEKVHQMPTDWVCTPAPDGYFPHHPNETDLLAQQADEQGA